MIGAESGGLLFHEQLGDLRKQRIERVEQVRLPFDPVDLVELGFRILLGHGRRHVSGESLQDGRHAEFSLPGEDLLLKLFVAVDPVWRQRAAPAVQAAHPAERQVGRPGQKRLHLFVGQAQSLTHRLPHGFLPGHRQRRVDAVERHPVDQPLPLRPVPPRQRVAEAAVVEEVAMPGPTDLPHLRLDLRQRRGQVKLTAAQRDMAMAVVFEIPIQSHRHRDAGVAANDDLVAGSLDLEDVAARLGRNHFET